MPKYKIVDVRLEPWCSVVSGKPPVGATMGPTPFDFDVPFEAELQKQVDIDIFRHTVLADPVFNSTLSDDRLAGDDAIVRVLKHLNALRGAALGNLTPTSTRYISYPGGGHTKATFLTCALNGNSGQWKLGKLQVKDGTGQLESEFEGCIALSVTYVPLK